MRTLVIGHDGLLGRAVCRALLAHGVDPVRRAIRWGTPHDVEDLAAAFAEVSAGDEPWHIAWCAGAGVTATPQHVFDAEIATFRSFVAHVAASGHAQRGTVFFASSAGGLYAGATQPPFSEATPPAPLAPYGHTKLALERALGELTGSGTRVAIGRISNLYGPGQNLAKPQGLVSQLCLSLQTGRPLGVYVSLDTLRDYIYVDDAAGLIVDFLATVSALPAGAPAVVKILASQQSVSIAEILGNLRGLTKRRPPVVIAASPQSAFQARDLRLRSTVLPALDRRAHVPFPNGVAATLRDVAHRYRIGELA